MKMICLFKKNLIELKGMPYQKPPNLARKISAYERCYEVLKQTEDYYAPIFHHDPDFQEVMEILAERIERAKADEQDYWDHLEIKR